MLGDLKCNFQTTEHVTVPYGEIKAIPLSSSPNEKDIEVYQDAKKETWICCSLKGRYGRCDQEDCVFFRKEFKI